MLGMISKLMAVVLIGMSIGWLVGLSSGALSSIILPALLTLMTSALAAVQLMSKPAVDPPPAISVYVIAMFMIGLVGGASLGTMARLGDWFSPTPAQIIERWHRWSQVVPRDEVVRRVFERTLPDPYRVNRTPPPENGPDALLRSNATCREVIARADTLGLDDLRTALRESKVPWADAIAPIRDVETLRQVAKNLCTGK